VQIVLHPAFRGIIDKGPIEVEGKTVGECLAGLVRLYPTLGGELYKKGGKLKQWIEIYVNSQCTYPEDLDYPVRDGDEIRVILLLFTGG
jgi:molybdopterin converting factor small subunit